MSFILDGKSYDVPDVYGVTKVINIGGVAIPNFNVPLIIGKQLYGIPFNAGGTYKGGDVIRGYSNLQALKKDYGLGTELVKAFSRAKAQGAGVVWVLGVNPLTQASVTLQDSTLANTITLKPTFWGAVGNDVSIEITTATGVTTITIVPPKNTKFISDSSTGTDKIVKFTDVENLNIGDTVFLTSNAAAYAEQSLKITEILNNGDGTYTITFDANISVSALKSDYARIYMEDTARAVTKSWATADYTLTNVMNWLATVDFLIATQVGGATLPPADTAKKLFQEISGATKGTSPDATETVGGTYDTLLTSLPQLLEEFEISNKLRVRLICPVTSNATTHGAFKSFATNQRAINRPVQVIVGSALGDIALAESNSAHPIKRSQALNHDDIILAGDDHDGVAAYLSHAPELLGTLAAFSPVHNLTRDQFSISKTAKFFGRTNAEETARYLRAGVMITETRSNGFVIAQGVNTYQDHTLAWNAQEAKTYLIQNRQVSDFVLMGMLDNLDALVGADGVTKEVAGRVAFMTLDKYKVEGFISDFVITEITKQQVGYVVKANVTLPDVSDFIGIILNILS